MTDILAKIQAAQVIVMATPVYFYTMNAQMKALIDRTVAGYTQIRDKEFYFIATAANGDKSAMERTIEGFRGFTACLYNAVEKGVVYGCGVWKKREVKTSPALAEAHALGKNA